MSGPHTFPNGDVYIGEWLEGNRHGDGKCTFANGNYYDGAWGYDKECGYGEYTDVEKNEIYSGEWEDGKKHGWGQLYSQTAGTKYTGQFEGGSFVKGRILRRDGTFVDGTWRTTREWSPELREMLATLTMEQIRNAARNVGSESLFALYIQQCEDEQEAHAAGNSRSEEHVEEMTPSTPDNQ